MEKVKIYVKRSTKYSKIKNLRIFLDKVNTLILGWTSLRGKREIERRRKKY